MCVYIYTHICIVYIHKKYDRVARHISSEMPLVHCTCTRRNLNGPRSTSFLRCNMCPWYPLVHDLHDSPATLDHLRRFYLVSDVLHNADCEKPGVQKHDVISDDVMWSYVSK